MIQGFAAALLLVPATARAQARLELTAGPLFALPRDGFADNVPQSAVGVSVSLGSRIIKGIPVILGGNLEFIVYGYESRREPYSVSVPDFEVHRTTWNDIMNAHLFARLQPDRNSVQPFIEGVVGFKYIFTESHNVNAGYAEGYPIPRTTDFSDYAFSLGAGAGISLRLRQASEGGERSGRGRAGINIETGVRLLAGSKAEYLRKGSITRIEDDVQFDVCRSRTDMVVFSAGLKWVF